MRPVKSCGVIVFRREPELSFLLLKVRNRVDLPKGHVEAGETEIECALRELQEETGLDPARVKLEADFRYAAVYYPRSQRHAGAVVEKTVVYFLGWLEGEHKVTLTEHAGYEWRKWPTESLGFPALDGLVNAVAKFFKGEE